MTDAVMPRWPSHRVSTVLFVLTLVCTWWAPPWPQAQALHHGLTMVALIVWWVVCRACPMSRRDHALCMIFLALHAVAARWLYSNVPYDRWVDAWLGFSLDQAMGWQRNQFDRLVHLAWGLCLMPPIHAWALARWTPRASHATAMAVGVIMISSVCYEWLEWGVALALSPSMAESYNGQQGDMWDAHKDMLMATLGALCWVPRLSRAAH
jgi:putative membrane protein